jgi:tight adherence protein C
MSVMLAVLTVVAVLSAYLLVDNQMRARRRASEMRTRIAPDGTTMDAEDFADQSIGMTGEPSAGAQGMLRMLRGMGIGVDAPMRQLEKRFAQAGIISADAPIYYMAAQRFGGVAAVAVAVLIALSATSVMGYLSALIVAALGVFGPHLYVQNAIDKRKQMLRRAFPDTLDLLLICVESGLALDASLMRVCAELNRVHPAMTAELNRLRMELTLLNDRTRALNNLAERTDMPAFRALVSSLIQSERFGTSLTDTLRVLSDEFRLQRMADAEVKAARLPVLITIPLIFLLMPAFFLIVLGPAIVRINNNGQQITGR